MTTTRAIVAHAHISRTGRIALAVIWLGLLVATCGLWQLQQELRRHPVTA